MWFRRQSGGSGPTMVHIRCTENDKLGNIYISNESNEFVFVFIYGWDPSGGQHADCTEGSDPSLRPLSVDNIETINGNGLIAIAKIETLGDVGDIEATRLLSADIGGDVTGDIVLTPNASTTAQRSGYIEVCNVAGDILGNILVQTSPIDGAGQVGTIDRLVVNGKVGATPGSSNILVDGRMLDCTFGSLNADVASTSFGPVGQIDDLFVVTTTSEDGKLHGEILVDEIDQVAGDPSTLSFAGGIASTGRVRIAQELLSGDGEIVLPTSGLVGRIIIGADGSAGTWTGPVDVGATTLAPVYSNTASSLGGGSVGRVPFEAHRTDSVPALNANLTFSTSAVTPSYDIRHYGPVRGGGAPLAEEPTSGGTRRWQPAPSGGELAASLAN